MILQLINIPKTNSYLVVKSATYINLFIELVQQKVRPRNCFKVAAYKKCETNKRK